MLRLAINADGTLYYVPQGRPILVVYAIENVPDQVWVEQVIQRASKMVIRPVSGELVRVD